MKPLRGTLTACCAVYAQVLSDQTDVVVAAEELRVAVRARVKWGRRMQSFAGWWWGGRHLRLADSSAVVLMAACGCRPQAEQFGHITGRFETEAMLDVVFAEFCIGK